jgi:hypothetical protein
MVKLLVPEQAGIIAAGSGSYKKQTRNILAFEYRKHVRQSIQQTIVASDQNGPWWKRIPLFDRRPELFRMKDAIVGFKKPQLRAKDLRLYKVPIEKFIGVEGIRRLVIAWNYAMIIYDRVASRRNYAIQISCAMQSRVHRAL